MINVTTNQDKCERVILHYIYPFPVSFFLSHFIFWLVLWRSCPRELVANFTSAALNGNFLISYERRMNVQSSMGAWRGGKGLQCFWFFYLFFFFPLFLHFVQHSVLSLFFHYLLFASLPKPVIFSPSTQPAVSCISNSPHIWLLCSHCSF